MKTRYLAVFIALVFIAACSNNDAERAALRDDLDAEFALRTEELIKDSDQLKTRLSELVESHKALDVKHEKLNMSLIGKVIYSEDKALQQKHVEWEKKHVELIGKAEALLSEFRESIELHEKLEGSHADVSLDKIAKEHEQFAEELKEFKKKFAKMILNVKRANAQMDVIFDEHEMIERKYR